jgi:hypothetical protein
MKDNAKNKFLSDIGGPSNHKENLPTPQLIRLFSQKSQ